MSLHLIELGELRIAKPLPGMPDYLSAASGVSWGDDWLHAVGDDQVALFSALLAPVDVSRALNNFEHCNILQPGVAWRIIPGDVPQDPGLAVEIKPDFEALTRIMPWDLSNIAGDEGGVVEEALMRYPNGLLLITGSGGLTPSQQRRSKGVVYTLDAMGNAIGIAAPIGFEGLHEYLEAHVLGKLNIEGSTVFGSELILAQRGNCIDKATGQPGENMLIRLSLLEVVRSILNDHRVDSLELQHVAHYNEWLGSITTMHDGQVCEAKLDFTDLSTVQDDPYGNIIFTAAAEGVDGPLKGKIAGSAVGLINGETGELMYMEPLTDTTIKPEGVEAWFNREKQRIEFLTVDDADNPANVAKLRGGFISYV